MHANKLSLAVLFISFSLFGCSGGGGDGSLDAPQRPAGTVSGIGYDGLILDGVVTIYAFENGVKGGVLGTGRTNFEGKYSVSIQSHSQPIFLEVSGGRYVEEASGVSIPLRVGQILRAVDYYTSGSQVQSNVTIYTSIAAGLAQYKIKVGASAEKAVKEANAEINSILGFNALTVTPKDITKIENASAFLTSELEYGFFEAAVSKWTAYASAVNNSSVHTVFSSIAFAQVAYDDVRYDGVLDGRGPDGPMSFGVIPMTTNIYRHDLAIYMLKMVQDPRNQTGLNAAKLLPSAIRQNDSGEAIYGGLTGGMNIDENGPTISEVRPVAGSRVFGNITLRATVTDVIGLQKVEFLLDGNLLGASVDLDAPSLEFNTRAVVDGMHTLLVRATNIAGTAREETASIVINNTAITITNIVPAANRHVRGTITLSANVTDAIGIASVEFLIDGNSVGSAPIPATPAVSINTASLADGVHTLTVRAVNSSSSVKTESVQFVADNTAPVFSAMAPPENTYLRGTFNATATAVDTYLDIVQFLVDGTPIGIAPNKNAASLPINTTQFADGAHTLTARAVDLAGSFTVRNVPVFFDNTPPVIDNIFPQTGTFVRGTFDVGANVSDLRVADVEFFIDGTFYNRAGSLTVPRTFVNSTALADGPHTIMIRATDAVGLVRTLTTTVIVDNTAPSISAPLVSQPAGLSCQVSSNSIDASAGLREVTLESTSNVAITYPRTTVSTVNGMQWFAQVPAGSSSFVVWYTITARDSLNNTSTYSFNVRVLAPRGTPTCYISTT